VQVGFDGSNDDLLDEYRATDAVQRYVYLGFVGNRLNLTAIASRWVAASALNVFGLRSGRAPSTVVAVFMPKQCPDLSALDWSLLSPWS